MTDSCAIFDEEEPEGVALAPVTAIRGQVLDAVVALAEQGHPAVPLDDEGNPYYSIEHATTDIATIRELAGEMPDGGRWGVLIAIRRVHQPRQAKPRFRMPQHISESRRNTTFASFVGWLLAYDFTEDETLAIALLMNSTRGDPPLPEKEVRDVVGSIARRHARNASPRRLAWRINLDAIVGA